jgi:hypothetical protein
MGHPRSLRAGIPGVCQPASLPSPGAAAILNYMAYAPTSPRQDELDSSYYDDQAGYGLVTFAGVMLTIACVLNTLYGIAALDDANIFVGNAHFVIGDLNTWGWLLVVLGVLQGFAAIAIWRGVGWGRWFGVACAAANAILQTFWIPAYPVMAMTIFVLDIVVIYALVVYGGRRRVARAAREQGRVAQ